MKYPFPTAPREKLIGTDLITPGKLSFWHRNHKLEEVDWDKERLGSSIINIDPDPGGKIAFPMATFKDLHRCKCGAEKVTKVRALI